jgi:hypothetical protein
MSSRCDSGLIVSRNARQRSSAPGASSWSASTGVIESVICLAPGAASTSSSGR